MKLMRSGSMKVFAPTILALALLMSGTVLNAELISFEYYPGPDGLLNTGAFQICRRGAIKLAVKLAA